MYASQGVDRGEGLDRRGLEVAQGDGSQPPASFPCELVSAWEVQPQYEPWAATVTTAVWARFSRISPRSEDAAVLSPVVRDIKCR